MAELTDLDIPPELDKPVTLKVDATHACELEDGGTLTAYASSENVENAEVKVDEGETKVFTLTFTPPSADKYSLTVKWGEDPIAGSPFVLNLNAPNSKLVTIAEPPQSNLKAGQSIGICFNASNAGRGELTASCEGEKVGEVPTEVTRRGISLKYDFKFLPPQEDVYHISIKLSGVEIKGSPFKLDLIPVRPDKVVASEIEMQQGVGAPIEMTIGTEDAGNAPLKATCQTSPHHGEGKHIDVPVTIKKLAKHNYQLSVQPPKEDWYSLEVTYGTKNIPNSPFRFTTYPVDASKVIVKEPEDPELGREVVLFADTGYAGTGTLSATCNGSRCGEMDVEIRSCGEGTCAYYLLFDPTLPDIYHVTVLWNDEEVAGSPVEVRLLLPPDASKVNVGSLNVPEEAGNDQYVWIDFDCSKTGYAEIKAEAKGTETEESIIPVEVETIDTTDFYQYRVKFKPERPDVYSFAILYGDEHIEGSPFTNIDLRGGPMPERVKHLGTDYPTERGGPIFLTFDTERAGNGVFRARVAGLSSGPTAATYDLMPDSKYTYQVSFTPQAADTYLVDVYWSDTPVPHSPFYVEIIYADRVRADQPKIVNMYHPVRFNVSTTDAGPGVLKATCRGAACGEVNVEINQDYSETAKYSIHFSPSQEDLYTLAVFFSDTEIPNSPFTIDLRPIIPTKLDKFIGDPLRVALDKGSLEGLMVDASGENTGDAEIRVSRNDTGYIEVLFDPTLPDRYSIDIKMDGEHVAGSPYIINYTIPVDASKCFVYGLELLPPTLLVDQEISFGVDATKAGDGVLTAVIDGSSSDLEPLPVTVIENKEEAHVYKIAYTPTLPGLHKVNLQWSEQPIPQSPLEQKIEVPKAPEVQEPIVLEAIPVHPLNKPLVFHFTTDCEPQDVRAYAIHDDTCNRYTLNIGKGNDGKLKLLLRAKLAGLHNIYFLIADKEIRGSPCKVRFVESDPSACKVVDIPEEAYTGEETSFKVDTSNAGEGSLHIVATVPPGGKGLAVAHRDHKNGFYSILFTPRVPGPYHFKIKWADKEIPESPLTLDVLQADTKRIAAQQAASRVHILKEDRYVFATMLPISKPAYFCVATGRANAGKLTLKARGPGEAKVRVVDRKQGIYTCEVKPSVSGKYLISMYWNDIQIPGSPYQLDFTGLKSYMICGLDLENEQLYLNIPFEFPVSCGNEDPSKLEVSCNPRNVAKIELQPQPETKDNVYMCRITPIVPGNHEIWVKYADNHIVNSPYLVQFDEKSQDSLGDNLEDLTVARPLTPLGLYLDMANEQVTTEGDHLESSLLVDPISSHVRAYGPGLSDGFIGQEGNFTIETAEADCGELEVEIDGPKGSFHLNMRRHPTNDRTILARYDPTHVGDYTISIKWSGTPIRKSPYRVHIAEQEVIAHEATTTEEQAEIHEVGGGAAELEIELHEIADEEGGKKCEDEDTEKKEGDVVQERQSGQGDDDVHVVKRDLASGHEEDVKQLDASGEHAIQQEIIEA